MSELLRNTLGLSTCKSELIRNTLGLPACKFYHYAPLPEQLVSSVKFHPMIYLLCWPPSLLTICTLLLTHCEVLRFLFEEDRQAIAIAIPFCFGDANQDQSVSVWVANLFLILYKQQANETPVFSLPVWMKDVDRKSAYKKHTGSNCLQVLCKLCTLQLPRI